MGMHWGYELCFKVDATLVDGMRDAMQTKYCEAWRLAEVVPVSIRMYTCLGGMFVRITEEMTDG